MPRGRKKKIVEQIPINKSSEDKQKQSNTLVELTMEELLKSTDDKKKVLDTLMRVINKQHGKGIMTTADDPKLKIKCIPTGIRTLDALLTRENQETGLPMGRTIELYGPEHSGKSTIALRFIAQAQKYGFMCAYLDSENAYDETWAIKQGVNTQLLQYSRLEKDDPESIEKDPEKIKKMPMTSGEVLQLVRTLVKSTIFKIVIVDSVASLVPRKELEGNIEDNQMALLAREMSKGMRCLTAENKTQGTIIIFINQLRSNIGVMYGNPNVTPGGRALKFFASLRMNVRSGESWPNKKEAEAKEVIVKLDKDKIFGKWEQDERFFLFRDGHIDFREDLKKKMKGTDDDPTPVPADESGIF